MALIKEESEDMTIEDFRVKQEDTETQTKSDFIKVENVEVKIEEAFRVKHEETEEPTDLMVLKVESQELNEDQYEKHDFMIGGKFIQTKKTSSQKTSDRFTCHRCGMCFNQKHKLNRHMRVHNVEKPVTCQQCGKRFSQKVILHSHMRIHTRDKPFQCLQCNRRFKCYKDMTRHLQTGCGIGLPLVLEIIASL
ncbi:zinc finger protein 200-like [Carassius carassius]|uniref:zinc finger protein 200-like n=1 Tax=Carassius carassius TaxID=217509 RepID=UPI002868E886|nr:zinc finger protein 200-like [Carassius carassius]